MTTTTTTTRTLIVCDVQPDVINKIQPNSTRRKFVDLLNLTVAAARKAACNSTQIIYTQLRFPNGYDEIPLNHPRLGVLRKLGSDKVKWFTSKVLCVAGTSNTDSDEVDNKANEIVVTRTTFLPQATDAQLVDALAKGDQQQIVTVIGYGPTVQSICHLLGDMICVSGTVEIIKECIVDEIPERSRSFLQHGLLFRETVTTLVDYLESLDMLHEQIQVDRESAPSSCVTPPPSQKYVCDVGRGGHLSLFMPYLTKQYGYVEWPLQPWYQERKSLSANKQYYCPLGRRVVELCDEPQFSIATRFFLLGRQFLDEKDLLYGLVPELMPPTFHTLQEAQEYAEKQQDKISMWFLKKVNQNGGRAVDVLLKLPTEPLAQDDQLQAHVPRPLLWEGTYKCHIKTYYFLSTCCCFDPQEEEGKQSSIEWHLYLHDLYFLATANKPWMIDDNSDDCQITTMRTQRLYPDHPWRMQWNLTQLCETHLQTVVSRAIEQGKLQVPTSSQPAKKETSTTTTTTTTMQFEINSADWMLSDDGRIYLIECNGIPVLYDSQNPNQPLCTKGLRLYDRLHKENPQTAVVDDHDLLKDAVTMVMKGNPPKNSLWKRIATIPAIEASVEE